MSTQANITSTEALEHFRSSLIVFSSRVQSVLDQLIDEIRRTRAWIQQDRRRYWESEVPRRARVLAQAQQELMSARMVGLLDNLSVQQAAVRKAKAALEEAEAKLRLVKRWIRDFDAAAEPLAKSLDSFRGVLARDLPHGIAFLAQAQTALAAYREVQTSLRPAASEDDAAAEPAEIPPTP